MTRVNGKSLARRAVARRLQSTDITGLAILQVHGFETSRSLKGSVLRKALDKDCRGEYLDL